jgi:hypothetical protein
MPKRSRKTRLPDPNVMAYNIVRGMTGDELPIQKLSEMTENGKNPAAVALGRLGGLKGGNARAKVLSAKRRIEIAAKAAKARWKHKKPSK